MQFQDRDFNSKIQIVSKELNFKRFKKFQLKTRKCIFYNETLVLSAIAKTTLRKGVSIKSSDKKSEKTNGRVVRKSSSFKSNIFSYKLV